MVPCRVPSSSSPQTGSSRESSATNEHESLGLVEFIEANELQLLAFNEYANERGTEVAVVEVHPDADSMAFHMEVVAERAATAYAQTVDMTTNIQVFGTPSKAVLDPLGRQAGAGVALDVKPVHLGGFVRR